MDIQKIPPLQTLFAQALGQLEVPEQAAVRENFLMEERVAEPRLAAYTQALGLGALPNHDAFRSRHEHGYLEKRVYLEDDEGAAPDTFNPTLNQTNFWPDIDENLALYRLEKLSFALDVNAPDEPELVDAMQAKAELAKAQQAEVSGAKLKDLQARAARSQAVLERLCTAWNKRRDLRPLFATTESEIDELLETAGKDWANALRDHLGLGHINPSPGEAVPILLMRYQVKEVLVSATTKGQGRFCIPTVLDGGLSPFFFPTPLPGAGAAPGAASHVGRAVNLKPAANQSGYRMGLELVHSYLDYHPKHLHRLGYVSRPISPDLSQLRSFHLD